MESTTKLPAMQAADLPPEHYHSPAAGMTWFSSHQVRDWAECPARTLAELRGEWERPGKDSFVFGSYVDCALTTPELLPTWCEAHESEMCGKRGRPLAWVAQAETVIQRLRRDPLCRELLTGEGQTILVGEIGGFPARCMIDVVKPGDGVFVDLKTARDFERGWVSRLGEDGNRYNMRVPWYEVWNYWWQLAWYRELLRQRYDREFLPIIVAATKQTPPDIGAWMFTDTKRLDMELEVGAANLAQYAAWRRGEGEPWSCGRCEYCRDRKVLTAISVAESDSGRNRR